MMCSMTTETRTETRPEAWPATRPADAPTGWIPDDTAFGARLALIRQRMGWGNIRKAAQECGLPPESWRTWERDGVQPNRILEIAAIISRRTGCDYAWLLGVRDHDGSINTRYGRVPVRPTSGPPLERRRPPERPTATSGTGPSPRRPVVRSRTLSRVTTP